MAAPINRIPSEILTLIPNSWSKRNRDRKVITMTHVCRAWREVLVSQASLWTDIGGMDPNKAEVYLERSKFSPINLSLYRDHEYYHHGSRCDPLYRIIPHTVERLKSLTIDGSPRNIQDITICLSRPAPLLEYLSIVGQRIYGQRLHHSPTSALFGKDLPSLRRLHLEYVCTELHWRNMVNLTSFTLVYASPVSVRQILDFFESAPRLCKVKLDSTIQTSGADNGRLVSLACLKKMEAIGGGSSLLLGCLLIPIGARLTAWVELPSPPTEGNPPRFLDNLKNLHGFTVIHLSNCELDSDPSLRFSGPNGEVVIIPMAFPAQEISVLLGHLTLFDTSRTERLEIDLGDPSSSGPIYQALLPMKDLRTLALPLCITPHAFLHALHPNVSPSGVVVCPKLEELVIEHRGTFKIEKVVGMAAARELRGARLKLVRIITPVQVDISELKKHVLHVKWDPEASRTDNDGDGSDEEY